MADLSEIKQNAADRNKVNAWLDHINETDEACRKEVLDYCAKDPEARAFYVSRYVEDCYAQPK